MLKILWAETFSKITAVSVANNERRPTSLLVWHLGTD